MTIKIYQDREFLYECYVTRRMTMKDICILMEKNYGVKITEQGLYNYIKKYDLLKYRGKGRKLGANMQRQQGAVRPTNPARARQAAIRKQMKGRKRGG